MATAAAGIEVAAAAAVLSGSHESSHIIRTRQEALLLPLRNKLRGPSSPPPSSHCTPERGPRSKPPSGSLLGAPFLLRPLRSFVRQFTPDAARRQAARGPGGSLGLSATPSGEGYCPFSALGEI